MHVIRLVKADLFKLVDSAPQREFVIAHGCNAQGKMGAGFAKEFAQRYPSSFQKYVKMLQDYKDQRVLGMVSWDTVNADMMFTASIITQQYYGKDKEMYVDIVAFVEGLATVITFARMLNLDVYIPLIGAGYGGLTPDQSMTYIRAALQRANTTDRTIGNVTKLLTVCYQ